MMRFVDEWRARRVRRLKPVRDDVLRVLHARYPFSVRRAELRQVLGGHRWRLVRRALVVLERDGFIAGVGHRRTLSDGAGRRPAAFKLTRSGLAFPPRPFT